MESSRLPNRLGTGNQPVAQHTPVFLKNRLDLTRLAELDRQFCEFAKLQRGAAPRCGWTKTIRLALGMSSRALGARLGMTPQGVRKLETGEANGTISLNALVRLAQGLDCELHYIFIPRTSLMEQVLKQTHEVMRDPDSPNPSLSGLLEEEQALDALSILLGQVNKRGLW